MTKNFFKSSMTELGTQKITGSLEQIAGPNKGQFFDLCGSEVLLGRNPAAAVRIIQASVSRNHCTFKYISDCWNVKDNKSQNGTYVNGTKVGTEAFHPIKDNDYIFLGNPKVSECLAFCFHKSAYCEKFTKRVADTADECCSKPYLLNKEDRKNCKDSLKRKKDEIEPQDENGENKKLENHEASNIHSVASCIRDLSSPAKKKPSGNYRFIRHVPFSENSNESPQHFLISQKEKENVSENMNMSDNLETEDSQSLIGDKILNPDYFCSSNSCNGHSISECQDAKERKSEDSEDSQSLIGANDKNLPRNYFCSIKPCAGHSFPNCQENVENAKSEDACKLVNSNADSSLQEKVQQLQDEIESLRNNATELQKQLLEKDELLKVEQKMYAEFENQVCNQKQSIEKRLISEFSAKIEEELSCNICTEIFLKATVLGCSHTFCEYCIAEWKKKKNQCPICREKIVTQSKVLIMDHFIDKVMDSYCPLVSQKRKELMTTRERNKNKKLPTNSRQKRIRRNARTNYNRILAMMGPGPSSTPRRLDSPTVVRVHEVYDLEESVVQQEINDVELPEIQDVEVEIPEIEDVEVEIPNVEEVEVELPAVADLFADSFEGYRESEYSGSDDIGSDDNGSDDSSSSVEGYGYYPGFGRCYNCGRRGHWANGCPDY